MVEWGKEDRQDLKRYLVIIAPEGVIPRARVDIDFSPLYLCCGGEVKRKGCVRERAEEKISDLAVAGFPRSFALWPQIVEP